MKTINLTDYADHSQKIPDEVLNGSLSAKTDVSSWKILFSHLIDLEIIASISLTFKFMTTLTLNHHLTTKMLKAAYNHSSSWEMNSFIFAMVFFSYFFFSYFFNHGQTIGMHYTKSRISMKPASFKSSLGWCFYSTMVFLTLGTLIHKAKNWLKEDGWGSFETHDHLYHELVTIKESAPVNLLNEIESAEAPSMNIYLDKAA